jgi:excisionase family DNA binding protein
VAKSSTTQRQHLLSINQAAEYAAVSTKTVRRRIADGTIPAVRLGPRAIRVRLQDIDAALRPIPTVGGGPGGEAA